VSVPLRWEELVPEETRHTPAVTLRRRPHKPHRNVFRVLARLVSFGVIGSLSCIGAASLLNGLSTETTLRQEAYPTPVSKVALGSASAERRLGYVTVTGQVANQTNTPLSKVEAVVELLDSRHQTVQMESAMIAFNPLPSGHASPFQVEIPDNSRAVAYRIRFKELLGAPLN
jgi:hypothetical protein